MSDPVYPDLEFYLKNGEYPHDKKIVCIFFGSFDPFHEGHYDVVRTVLKNYCSRIICGVIRSNSGKPNISSYRHRYQLLKLALQLDPNVFVVDNTYSNIQINDVINISRQILPDHQVWGIIGSDTYLKSRIRKNFPRMSVDKFLMVPRNDFPINNFMTNSKYVLMGKNMFNGKGLTLSSTQIREAIINDHEIDSTNLCDSCHRYIIDKSLYIDKSVFVYDIIKNFYKKDREEINLTNMSRPFSGHTVYLVSSRNIKLCVAKIFTGAKKYESEINMLQWMGDNNIPTVKIIHQKKLTMT